jgi:hypothetical protein
MSPESSGPAGLGQARWPGGDGWSSDDAGKPDPDWPSDDAGKRDPGWPDDHLGGGRDDDAADWRDPDWPGDDAADERDPDWPDDWPDEDQADPPWRRAAPPAAYGPGGRGRRSLRPLALTVVAVVALGAGAGVALAVGRGLGNSGSPSATPSSQPSYGAPGGSGGGTVPGGGAVPGGGSGAVGQGFIEGRVTAVSSTSITIGGPGQSMTAAITAATKVTGNVTSIGSVKVGDEVSAQITVSGGQATVTAIQDPAQTPSGSGGPP